MILKLNKNSIQNCFWVKFKVKLIVENASIQQKSKLVGRIKTLLIGAA